MGIQGWVFGNKLFYCTSDISGMQIDIAGSTRV
jgi:hypothetical protein